MKRDTARLRSERFDVLVVGGGIHGAALAHAATLRGLNVALIEQADFGGATSANSLKVIHGGLRYLQHLDVRRMRESIMARRRMLQLAPHLVRPCPFVVPTYGAGMESRMVMAAALLINDLLSCDRNRGVRAERHIPGGHVLSRSQCLRIMPDIERRRLTGGALWYDALVCDTERLTLSFLLSADAQGACIANYARMESCISAGDRVAGAVVTDLLDGAEFEIQARCVVNATGPWRDTIGRDTPGRMPARPGGGWAKAVNLVVRRPLFGDYAVGLAGSHRFRDHDAVINKGKRYYMFVPWQGGTLVGTSYRPWHGQPGECRVTGEDIDVILEEVARIYPAAELSIADISFAHAGLLPMDAPAQGGTPDVVLSKHERIVGHDGTDAPRGCFTVTGVKYTTSVQVADKVMKLILQWLGHGTGAVGTEAPLAGGEYPAGEAAGPDTVEERLKARYGMHYHEISRYGADDPSLTRPVAEDSPVLGTEIIHAVRCEMACRLTDVVMRRTGLGTSGNPGQAAIRNCASLMAAELDWDAQRQEDEIHAVGEIYRVYGPARPDSAGGQPAE